IEDVGRGRLDQHLELIVVLQAKRIVAIASIRRTPRGLYKRGSPRLRTDGTQEGRGVKRPRAHRHVVGLQDHAALLRPIALQREDQVLKCARRGARSLVLHPDRQSMRQALLGSARVYASRWPMYASTGRPARKWGGH